MCTVQLYIILYQNKEQLQKEISLCAVQPSSPLHQNVGCLTRFAHIQHSLAGFSIRVWGAFGKICTCTVQPYRILHQIVGCIWQDLYMYSAALQDSPPDCGVHLARFVHVQCSLTGFSTRLWGAFGKICTCIVQPYRILHQIVGCIWQDLYMYSAALQGSPADCGVHLARFVLVQYSLTGFSIRWWIHLARFVLVQYSLTEFTTRLLGAFSKVYFVHVQYSLA